MGLVIKKKQPVAHTSVVHSEKGQVVTEQTQQELVGEPVTLMDGPHASIEVSTSLTINLGKFNSVKVGVGITLPAALNELDDVFEYGRSWMNQKMEQLAADVSPDAPAED